MCTYRKMQRNQAVFVCFSSMMDTALIDDSYSLLSESEYDKTGDDLLMSRVKRRSKRKSHQNRSSELSMPRHVLTDATLKKYSKPPTAPPPESEGTGGDLTPPKRRRLVGGETETSVDTEDSLRPAPQTEVKLRRSTRRHNRSLSAGMVVTIQMCRMYHLMLQVLSILCLTLYIDQTLQDYKSCPFIFELLT